VKFTANVPVSFEVDFQVPFHLPSIDEVELPCDAGVDAGGVLVLSVPPVLAGGVLEELELLHPARRAPHKRAAPQMRNVAERIIRVPFLRCSDARATPVFPQGERAAWL
jgi:hypothetical protein